MWKQPWRAFRLSGPSQPPTNHKECAWTRAMITTRYGRSWPNSVSPLTSVRAAKRPKNLSARHGQSTPLGSGADPQLDEPLSRGILIRWSKKLGKAYTDNMGFAVVELPAVGLAKRSYIRLHHQHAKFLVGEGCVQSAANQKCTPCLRSDVNHAH